MTQSFSPADSRDKRRRVFHTTVVMTIRLGVLFLLLSPLDEQLREENGLWVGTFIASGLFGFIVARHSPSVQQIRLDWGRAGEHGLAGRTHLQSSQRKMLVRGSRLVVAAWLLMLAVLEGESGNYFGAMVLVVAAAAVAVILGPVADHWYARVLRYSGPRGQTRAEAEGGSKPASVHWSQNRKLMLIAFFSVYPFMIAFVAVVSKDGSIGGAWAGGIAVAIAYPFGWLRVREYFD